jgi:hypothetical protein
LSLDRNGIRKLEILPISLEETVMNHITNLRRVQTERNKSEIEKSPSTRKPQFCRSYTYCQTKSTLETPKKKQRSTPLTPDMQHSRSLINFDYEPFPSSLDLPTADTPSLSQEPRISNWSKDIREATEHIGIGLDILHLPSCTIIENGTNV